MPGIVTRDTQTLPIASPMQQGAATITSSGTALDGTTIQEPFVLLLDENTPSRKVSPAGDDTLQAILACSTATITSVAASTTSVVLLAANAVRLGAILTNDSTSATLYLAYAATATTSAYTVKLLPGALWEVSPPIYRGVMSGIWTAASGNCRISELS